MILSLIVDTGEKSWPSYSRTLEG